MDPGMTKELVKSYINLTKSYTQILPTEQDCKHCKYGLQSGEVPKQNSMVESFKHSRNFGSTYPVEMGGGLFPPPQYKGRRITDWCIMYQILDRLVDMWPKVEQVNGDGLPNTEKLTLADFGVDYWSDVSPD